MDRKACMSQMMDCETWMKWGLFRNAGSRDKSQGIHEVWFHLLFGVLSFRQRSHVYTHQEPPTT